MWSPDKKYGQPLQGGGNAEFQFPTRILNQNHILTRSPGELYAHSTLRSIVQRTLELGKTEGYLTENIQEMELCKNHFENSKKSYLHNF